MGSMLDVGYGEARKRGTPGSGGTPGAKPQYEQPTPLDRVVDFVRGIGKRLNSTGNSISPTTRTDQGHTGASTTLTDAERDRLSKRYLGR